MAPVSRLANLAENVCKAKVFVPYSSLLLVEDVHFEGNHQSSILELSFSETAFSNFINSTHFPPPGLENDWLRQWI